MSCVANGKWLANYNGKMTDWIFLKLATGKCIYICKEGDFFMTREFVVIRSVFGKSRFCVIACKLYANNTRLTMFEKLDLENVKKKSQTQLI